MSFFRSRIVSGITSSGSISGRRRFTPGPCDLEAALYPGLGKFVHDHLVADFPFLV